jgi:hypothetical protein
MIGTGEYISLADAIEAMYKDAEAHPDHTFWASQFEALMDIPAADVQPRWIPVTERLPEEDGHYLVCIFADELSCRWSQIAWFRREFYWVHGTENGREVITHWMPLPGPPKIETKEE